MATAIDPALPKKRLPGDPGGAAGGNMDPNVPGALFNGTGTPAATTNAPGALFNGTGGSTTPVSALGGSAGGNMDPKGGTIFTDPGGAAGGNMNPKGGTVFTDPGGAAGGNPNPFAPGAPVQPTPPPAAPVRTNFKWGVQGVGHEGVNYGSTDNWTDAQWQEYEGRGKPATAAPSPSTPPATTGPVGQPAAAGQITTAGDVTGTTAPVGATPAQGAPTTVAGSFQQALVNRLNPAQASAQDPNIRPAIQANQYAEQRGFENNRALAAENAARNGGKGAGSGDFETTLLGLAQDRAAREGQYSAGAVQHLSDLQNQNQTNAMGQANGLLSSNQQSELQRYLGNQDAELRRLGINQQGSLGSQDIALRGRLGEGQLNLGLLQALMGNDQFGRSLNQNSAQFGQSLDQSGLLGLLGLI